MKQHITDSRPRAVASGTIFGGVDCYVFGDGSTVLSQRGMLRGLRGKATGAEDGDLGRYLTRLPEKYSGLAAAPIAFTTPDGAEAMGRPAHDFVAMCRAYADMYADGSIHKARIPIARNCIAILAGLADVGIDEVIYRASNWHPTAIVQAPALDIAALVTAIGDATRLAVQEVVLLARRDIAEMRSSLSSTSGTITGMQVDDIRRAIIYCSMATATLGDRSFDAARKSYNQMLAGVVGWGGTGRQAHLMPASKYPEAMALLRAIRSQLDRRLRDRDLPLPVVGGRQTEMFSAIKGSTTGNVVPLKGRRSAA